MTNEDREYLNKPLTAEELKEIREQWPTFMREYREWKHPKRGMHTDAFCACGNANGGPGTELCRTIGTVDKTIRRLLSEIDRLNAEREWVSVETRLPQEKVIVFVLCGEELFPASGMLDEGYWRDGIIALSDVRMWREVNLPVQEGEKK